MDEPLIMNCVGDFNRFIQYIETEKPVLSEKSEIFGKKDSYKMNSMLENQKIVSVPHYNQDQYPVIDLMFELALLGNLYYKGINARGKLVFIKTPMLDSYFKLNDLEKYVFLLQTYWTKYEFIKMIDRWRSVYPFYAFLAEIAKAKPGQEILKNEKHQTNSLYFEAAAFQHQLKYFGIGEPELIIREKWIYDDTIRAFYPTSFGIKVARFLCTKALECWNSDDFIRSLISEKKSDHKMDIRTFREMEKKRILEIRNDSFNIFKNLFPEGQVANTVEDLVAEDKDGVYCFKVSLSKTIWRKIKMSGRHTLGDLHDTIQVAFEFDDDHLYAFYIDGNEKTGKPVYCQRAKEGGTSAEALMIQEMGLLAGQRLVYLFDFGACWKFSVELMGIDREEALPLTPVIVEEKGEAPLQYKYQF